GNTKSGKNGWLGSSFLCWHGLFFLGRDQGIQPGIFGHGLGGLHQKLFSQRRFFGETLGIHFPNPFEEGNQFLALFGSKIILWHPAFSRKKGFWILKQKINEDGSPLVIDLGQFRGVIAAFSQDGVTSHAVLGIKKM